MKELTSQTKQPNYIFVDAHVHFYNCYNENEFINSAFNNFLVQAKKYTNSNRAQGIIMLTESGQYNWFSEQMNIIHQDAGVVQNQNHPFCKSATNEDISFSIMHNNHQVFVIAGRQIITLEGLEVLALGTAEFYPDGEPVNQTLEKIWSNNAISVMPWAVGKWLGKRGKIINKLIRTVQNNAFLLGDNSGRPYIWPKPRSFKLAEEYGIHILPGSDPLPLPWEQKKAGSFGAILDVTLDLENPARQIMNILKKKNLTMHRYGKLEKATSFMRNQIALRI